MVKGGVRVKKWEGTEALKNGFGYRGVVSWNVLSCKAKQATTLSKFYSFLETDVVN